MSPTSLPSDFPLDEFKLFPELPIELQLQIWKNVIPRARIVKLQIHSKWGRSKRGTIQFSTDVEPSPLLRVCKASSGEILKVLNVCIEMDGSERKIRIDGENDTVYLWELFPDKQNRLSAPVLHDFSWGCNYHGMFSGIKTLILDTPKRQYIPHTLRDFPSLNNILIQGAPHAAALYKGEEMEILDKIEEFAPHYESLQALQISMNWIDTYISGAVKNYHAHLLKDRERYIGTLMSLMWRSWAREDEEV